MSLLTNRRKDFLIPARLSKKMFADILNDSSPRRLTSPDRHA